MHNNHALPKHAAILLAAMLITSSGSAEMVEIDASADTTIRQAFPDENFGADPILQSGPADGVDAARTLVRFNLAGAIPPGATILSARLSVHALDEPVSADQPGTLKLYRALRFWNEGGGSETRGSAVVPHEVTWNRQDHPSALWTRPGGLRGPDFASRPSADVAAAGSGVHIFGPTRQMTADVQNWLDQRHANEGWFLAHSAIAAVGGTRSFASREEAGRAPRLTVEYRPAVIEDLAPSAEYLVVFRPSWSSATHPGGFPVGAHWSGLVGGLHDSRVAFWRRGAPASEGIRRMAEFGAQSDLLNEVNAAIAAGTASEGLLGDGINAGSGRSAIRFRAEIGHPLVTLTSMVAPSPDWFVGVRGLPLVEKGRWGARKIVPLFAYDAGTDSGVTFDSPNKVTNPRGVITRIISAPLANNRGQMRRMGTLSFVRVSAR